MIDLSAFSVDELRRLADEEIARRKAAALRELTAVAERHGYSMSDLTDGCRASTRRAAKRRAHGEATSEIRERLLRGENLTFIAKAMGYKNSGSVFQAAKKLQSEMQSVQ